MIRILYDPRGWSAFLHFYYKKIVAQTMALVCTTNVSMFSVGKQNGLENLCDGCETLMRVISVPSYSLFCWWASWSFLLYSAIAYKFYKFSIFQKWMLWYLNIINRLLTVSYIKAFAVATFLTKNIAEVVLWHAMWNGWLEWRLSDSLVCRRVILYLIS